MNKLDQINKYYLYQHIRLDKNEIFYIGIGTKVFPKKLRKGRKKLKLSMADIYARAYMIKDRNNLWTKIYNKAGGRKVEILIENSDYNIIRQEEIRLIALYGRKNLKRGTLANLTDGGEQNLERINRGFKPVYMYNLDGSFNKEFKSLIEAAEYLNTTSGFIGFGARSAYLRLVKGFIFRKFKKEKIEIPKNSIYKLTNKNGKTRIRTKQKIILKNN